MSSAGVVGDVEVEWKVIDRALRNIAAQRCGLDVEEARWLRKAERRKVWSRLGFVSALEYLEAVFGYGPRVAVERMRVAIALGELPAIECALAQGHVTYSAARELTRIATTETEVEWLDATRGLNLRCIEQLVAGRKKGDRPEDRADPELANRVVRFELPPAVFALLRQAQQVIEQERGEKLDDAALIEALARSAIDGAAGTSSKPAHQVAVTVCTECKRGWQHGAGARVELPAAAIERAMCDAQLVDEDGEITHSIPQATRRKVMIRDEHRCRVPGCRSAQNLDVHHIVHREHGGDHDPANLIVLCSGHHISHHDGALGIRGRAPDQLVFERGGEVIVDPQRGAIERDAVQALVQMGFKPATAREAVKLARAHVGTEADLEALLRAALRSTN